MFTLMLFGGLKGTVVTQWKKIWTGGVNVADGELQKSNDAYLQQLEFVGKIGMPPRNHRPELIDDLRAVLTLICNDLETISDGNN